MKGNRPGDDDVDRYVRGKMSDDERHRFELAFFEDESLLKEVELTTALVAGIKNRGEQLTERYSAPSRPEPSPTLLRRLGVVLVSPQWSAAATLAALTLGALAVLSPTADRWESNELVIVRSVALEGSGLRSGADGGEVIPVELPAPALGLISFDLSLPYEALTLTGQALEITLQRADGGEAVHARARVQEDGFSQVIVPSAALETGRYLLQVRTPSGSSLMEQALDVRQSD